MTINPAETHVMKTENTNQPHPECDHLTRETDTNHGRRSRAWKPILVITSTAFCLCLNSCVIPVEGHGGNSSSYRTYQPGYRVQTLPRGYRREVISGQTYYYDGGNYYRRSGDGYLIAEAPRSSRYYSDYGRIHQQSTSRYDSRDYGRRDDRRDRDGVIAHLPDGYRVVNYRGSQYYKVGDRYYIRQNDRYTMVARPY